MRNQHFYIITQPGPGMVIKPLSQLCEACFARAWADTYDYEQHPINQAADGALCDKCEEPLATAQ